MKAMPTTEPGNVLSPISTEGAILRKAAEKTPPRVLVADEESLSRWAIGETLEGFGFEVVRALDSLGAVRALIAAGKPFDVVVLDLERKGESLSLLTFLRIMSPGTAVIVTSAFDTPDIGEAIRRGARLALRKPFEMRDLASAVLEATGGDW